jgi:undecaprenyl-diphosphatase
MQAVTFFGSSAVGLGLCVGCSVATYVRRRQLDRYVFLPLVAVLGSAPINFGLRSYIGRVRPGVEYIPHHLPELSHPFQRWSYPAGHTMIATICYGLLAAYLLGVRPGWRPWVLGLLATWLLAIGFSRVYLGVHWPTDVLAGYLAGGAWLSFCCFLFGGDSPLSLDPCGRTDSGREDR